MSKNTGVDPESFTAATSKLGDALMDDTASWSDIGKMLGLSLLTMILLVLAAYVALGFLGGPVWLTILIINWMFL